MYFDEETLQTARSMELREFLLKYSPNELVHITGETYCTREHDSLKISNGMWYWFSRGIGGRSALDYLIKVKGIPFTEAVGMILGRAAEMPPVSHIQANPRALQEAQKQVGLQATQETLSKPDAIGNPDAISEPGGSTKQRQKTC